MLTAAVDTSGRHAAFCVYDDQTCVMEHYFDAVGRASAELMPSMLAALDEQKLGLGDIRSWRVGMGPGSFSGIRSGAALVAGICRGTGAEFGGVASSYAMARASTEDVIEVLHDGRRGEVIRSVYKRTEGAGAVALVDAPAAIAISDLSREALRGSLVMLQDDPALPLVKSCYGAVSELPHVPIGHLISGTMGPLDPIYVRPAVFVTPKKIRTG